MEGKCVQKQISFDFQVVGKWFNSLELNLDHLVWDHNETNLPTSACSLPCEPGMIKKQQVNPLMYVNACKKHLLLISNKSINRKFLLPTCIIRSS